MLFATPAFAQNGFFVPPAGKIFFTGDSSTIFSDVINKGRLGIGRNAVVNFTARNWDNDPLSAIPDDSDNGTGVSGTGGWIRFMSDSFRQVLLGGYNAASQTGPSFPRVNIQNPYGLSLQNASVKVRNGVQFTRGSIFLQDQVFVVGNQNPGFISGYDSVRFFVTGNKANTGFLMRENIRISDGLVVFPIGTNANVYTPAAIRVRDGVGDDYYVGVADGVYKDLPGGEQLYRESINKTWQAGKRNHPGEGDVELLLQHRLAEEGDYFERSRAFAYISQYRNSGWDTGYPQHFPVPGYFGFGRHTVTDGINSRVFNGTIGESSFFTKLTGNGEHNVKTKLFFNAYRIDPSHVRVYWNTNPEINVKSFVVQRRLSNETVFRDVDTVASLAFNGFSDILLNYETTDPNNYTGISYYRLRALEFGNTDFYSDVVPVGAQSGLYTVVLWPNPTPDEFHLSIPLAIKAKSVVVWNIIGQKLKEEKVNGRTIVSMRGLLPGAYLVSIVLDDNRIFDTKKLVVAGQ